MLGSNTCCSRTFLARPKLACLGRGGAVKWCMRLFSAGGTLFCRLYAAMGKSLLLLLVMGIHMEVMPMAPVCAALLQSTRDCVLLLECIGSEWVLDSFENPGKGLNSDGVDGDEVQVE